MFKKILAWFDVEEVVEVATPKITQPIKHILELMEKTPERFEVSRDDLTSTPYIHNRERYRYTIKDTLIPDVEFIVYVGVAYFSSKIVQDVTEKYPKWVSRDEANILAARAKDIVDEWYKKELEEQERLNIIEREKEAYKQQRDKDRILALYGEMEHES